MTVIAALSFFREPGVMKTKSNKGAKAYFAEYPAATLPELAVESRNDRNRLEMLKTVLNYSAVRAGRGWEATGTSRAVEAGQLALALTLIKEGADSNTRFTGEARLKRSAKTRPPSDSD
jgi:hypothetical protein